jgi:hypothetical protein
LRIEQGHLPRTMKHFPGFMTRYGLKPYRSPRRPAVFWGCYNEAQLKLLRAHRALGLMVWLGTDALLQMGRPLWKRRDNFRHIAIGPWIERDLKRHGLPYRRINLYGSPLLEQLHPTQRGRLVYSYVPQRRDAFFGGPLVRRVRTAMTEVQFHVQRDLGVKRSEMPALYARCGLGLRLTKSHDGGCETAIELGLMGRRTIYNGDMPSAIEWSGLDDIRDAIEAELDGGAIPSEEEVADATKRYVEWGTDWLETEAWR